MKANRAKAFILAIVGLLTAPVAFAQNPALPPTTVYAVTYGQWSIPSQTPNIYTFYPVSSCQIGANGTIFPAFSRFGTAGIFAPVYVVDSNPANSELLTPTSLVNTSSQCGVNISPANQHTSFSLRSGSAGLQEGLDALAAAAVSYPINMILDRNWYNSALSIPSTTPAGIIAAAKGSTSVYLEDVTTTPHTFYVWNGTAYSTTGNTFTNAAPAVAAGAGAGTSPTISIAGSAGIGTVSLTSGTSTTTGALFTLTWASTGAYQYAPTCVVKSIGANSYTTFTSATTHPSGALLTVTVATTPPVASTAYKFSYTCQ